jgi:hypothetical protein
LVWNTIQLFHFLSGAARGFSLESWGFSRGSIHSEVSNKSEPDIDAEKKKTIDWTIQKASRTGRFWALMIFTFLAVLGVYIILVHHVKFLVDLRINKMATQKTRQVRLRRLTRRPNASLTPPINFFIFFPDIPMWN